MLRLSHAHCIQKHIFSYKSLLHILLRYNSQWICLDYHFTHNADNDYLILVKVSVSIMIEPRAVVEQVIIVDGVDISISWQIINRFIGYACSFVVKLFSGSDKIDPEGLSFTICIIVVYNCCISALWKSFVVNHTACSLRITGEPVWFLGPQDNFMASAAQKQVGVNSVLWREYARSWKELENGRFLFCISSRESKDQDGREERCEFHSC
ncbi:hypothetical protein AB4K20DRAFT_1389904 [Rhizopus microsporus]|uniref:Uncharacterized protein n=1 Tax=Rhizopus microsporus TaxID=58291 RepID=A0A1X0S8I7_RHIZD|nr:hypothetical protein BCV71DRAFT_79142 [Rhizopus microsporus]